MNIDTWKTYKETGSKVALNTLVTQAMPLVHKAVRRFTKGRVRNEDWEDLVQNASMGLLKAIDRWSPDKGRWEPFAYSYMRMILQRMIPQQMLLPGQGRNFQRHVNAPAVLFDDDEETIFRKMSSGSVSERETLLDEMIAAVQTLPAEERKVIERRFLEEQPLREVALAMGVSTGTVFNIEKRAIERLRKRAA